MTQLPETASLMLPSTFDPIADAHEIHRSIANKEGADGAAHIIIPRTIAQRSQIKATYEQLFSSDLIQDLKVKDDNLETLLQIMFNGPINHAAKEMSKKLNKEEVDDVMCTLNHDEMNDLKKAYDAFYSRSDKKTKRLEEAITDYSKGAHQRFLTMLLRCERDDLKTSEIYEYYKANGSIEGLVNNDLLVSDYFALLKATEGKKTNEDAIVDIIGKRNNLHLKCLYQTFKANQSLSLVEYISKHVKAPLKNSLNTTIMNAVDERLLNTAQMYHSMKGLGTKESQLGRVIATRAEIDLELLKVIYEERIGKNLAETVASETSGDLKNYLIGLLNVPVKK